MRATGIEVVGSVPWGAHFCQFYETAQDLVDILVPYFAAGLAGNEFCMWVTSEPMRAAEAKAALEGAVGDVEPYLRSGQLEILDYSEWYTAGGAFDARRVLQGWVDKLAAAQEKGFEGLRLTGNTFWLEEAGWQDFTEYEAAVNNVIGRYPMLALCTYSLGKCGAPEILDVMSNHAFALIKREGVWQIIESGERKRAEEALRESEARYRKLFENMTDGFAVHEIICDERGEPVDYRFLDVNPAFERLTGLKRGEVVGRTVREVLPEIEPYWIETYGRAALAGEPAYIENYSARLGRWYEALAYQTARGRFAAVFSDITERKRAEEALRAKDEMQSRAEALAHLGSWELDLANDRLSWSDEAYRIFGLEPQEFGATYEAFLEAVHPEDRAAVDASYRDSLREGKGGYEIEHRIVRRRTGEVRWVHEKCEHVRDAEGRIIGSTGMVLDVTDRKRAEEERERISRELLAAEEARAALAENLASEISHRTRNNLAIITGLLQMQAGLLPRESPAAAHLHDAVARICTFSVLHGQLHERGRDEVELVEALRRIADVAREALSKDDTEITVSGDAFICPPQAATNLCVAANELITNALKYGAAGERDRLEIKIRVSREAGRLRLTVWNSGEPVAEEFSREKRTTLGLSIVEGLAATRYGGSFVLRPRGHGSEAMIDVEERELFADEAPSDETRPER